MIIGFARKLLGITDDKLHNFLWDVTEKFPSRCRDIRVEDELYLRRFYITPRRKDPYGNSTGRYLGFGVYLHYFYVGDEDRQLHNHPWKYALSYILTGGYMEERRNNNSYAVETRDVKTGTFNFISADDFHRVIKKPGGKHVWTLFFTGFRNQDWGFWNRETQEFTIHSEYVKPESQGYRRSA